MNLEALARIALPTDVLAIGMPFSFGAEGGAVKWTPLLVPLLVVLGVFAKHEMIGNKNIEPGEYGVPRRWGNVRVDKKTGHVRLRTTGGRNFYIKHVSDYLIQNIRARNTPARPTVDHLQLGVYHTRKIEYTLVFKWRVEDDVDSVVKSLLALSQTDRADQKDTTLEDYVYNQMRGVIAEYLSEFDDDGQNLPKIILDPSKGAVPRGVVAKVAELKDFVGVIVEEVSTPNKAPTGEQVLADALRDCSPEDQPLLGVTVAQQTIRRSKGR